MGSEGFICSFELQVPEDWSLRSLVVRVNNWVASQKRGLTGELLQHLFAVAQGGMAAISWKLAGVQSQTWLQARFHLWCSWISLRLPG